MAALVELRHGPVGVMRDRMITLVVDRETLPISGASGRPVLTVEARVSSTVRGVLPDQVPTMVKRRRRAIRVMRDRLIALVVDGEALPISGPGSRPILGIETRVSSTVPSVLPDQVTTMVERRRRAIRIMRDRRIALVVDG